MSYPNSWMLKHEWVMINFIFLESLASVNCYFACHWKNMMRFRLRNWSFLFAFSALWVRASTVYASIRYMSFQIIVRTVSIEWWFAPRWIGDDWWTALPCVICAFCVSMRSSSIWYHDMFYYRWYCAWEEWCENGGYQSCLRPCKRQVCIGLHTAIYEIAYLIVRYHTNAFIFQIICWFSYPILEIQR